MCHETSNCGLSSVVCLYCVCLHNDRLHRVGCVIKHLTVDCPQLYVCTVYVYNDRLHRVGCDMKHLTVDCPQLYVCTVYVYNDRLHRVGCDVKHLNTTNTTNNILFSHSYFFLTLGFAIAQLIEHWSSNLEVSGSNPGGIPFSLLTSLL